jgi:hypothetical protein
MALWRKQAAYRLRVAYTTKAASGVPVDAECVKATEDAAKLVAAPLTLSVARRAKSKHAEDVTRRPLTSPRVACPEPDEGLRTSGKVSHCG